MPSKRLSGIKGAPQLVQTLNWCKGWVFSNWRRSMKCFCDGQISIGARPCGRLPMALRPRIGRSFQCIITLVSPLFPQKVVKLIHRGLAQDSSHSCLFP